MYNYFYVGNIALPAYGVMVMTGCVVCQSLAQYIVKRAGLSEWIFLCMEVSGVMGAMAGAKLLTICTAWLTDSGTLTMERFLKAGNSYYGGLAGFLLFTWITCHILKIEKEPYAQNLILFLPLLQAFWKVGCFFAGCCSGGIWMGTRLFPVQLLEAAVALSIFTGMAYAKLRKYLKHPVAVYLISYGVTRFMTEYLRYHRSVELLYIIQMYSVVCVSFGGLLMTRPDKRENRG